MTADDYLHSYCLYTRTPQQWLFIGYDPLPSKALLRSKRIGVGHYHLFRTGQLRASWTVVNNWEVVIHFPQEQLPERVRVLLEG